MGILNIYGFLRERSSRAEPEWLARDRAAQGAAAITHAGLERRDPVASEALDLMVSVYGAQAGNLALTVMATGGVYLGGGIAPKILPLLQRGDFMEAFRNKPPMEDLLTRTPVRVIMNPEAGVLGAAVYANEM
jgi:glucokinase